MLLNSQTKQCARCHETKEESCFGKDISRKDRLCVYCRECTNHAGRVSKKKHAVSRVAYNKSYRDANRDVYNENGRRYYDNNAGKLGRSAKKWRESYSGTFKMLHIGAKTRAKKKGIPYNIDDVFLQQMSETQGDKCLLTGIPFELSSDKGFAFRPYAPSVDRKDNARGYTPDNVQLVCVIVNKAKNEYPQSMFDEMCTARARQLTGE